MKKLLLLSILIIALSSIFVMLNAINNETDYNLNVFPNPMETNATVSLYFTDKIPIMVTLTTFDDVIVKSIFVGISAKGQMLIPFDRMDDKGFFIPKGKYWIVLSTNAKYTSTKKLLILK